MLHSNTPERPSKAVFCESRVIELRQRRLVNGNALVVTLNADRGERMELEWRVADAFEIGGHLVRKAPKLI